MVKIFGKKITEKGMKRFAYKVGREANVIGRKTLNTIDKVAPMAAIVATAAGHPEIAAAIGGAQALAHAGDKAIRSGVAVATAKKGGVDNALVNFGEDVNAVKRDAALLRQS